MRMSKDAPQIEVLDFDALANLGGSVEVTGTASDLIRDAHDNPVRWLHNCHARPDDCKRAFLVGRGWFATHDRRKALAESGYPIMAINDYPKDLPAPRYWVAGDPAGYYGERIWNDESVMKFTAMASRESVRPREDAYAPRWTPRDAPNIHHYHQAANDVDVEGWLHKPWINWGATVHGKNVPSTYFEGGAARSSMLCGMRLLWHLGYREVCLVGCDATPGHHPAPMYWPSVIDYLRKLRPTFDRYKFGVYQTNPDSHIRCFDFVNFEEAIAV